MTTTDHGALATPLRDALRSLLATPRAARRWQDPQPAAGPARPARAGRGARAQPVPGDG